MTARIVDRLGVDVKISALALALAGATDCLLETRGRTGREIRAEAGAWGRRGEGRTGPSREGRGGEGRGGERRGGGVTGSVPTPHRNYFSRRRHKPP